MTTDPQPQPAEPARFTFRLSLLLLVVTFVAAVLGGYRAGLEIATNEIRERYIRAFMELRQREEDVLVRESEANQEPINERS